MKLLVAISPQGSIVYISELWGGRASDRHIVAKGTLCLVIKSWQIGASPLEKC